MKKNKYIFIVQVARQLCVDILNDFAEKDAVTELYTGEISNSYNELNKNIKVHFLCKYNKSNSFQRLFTWSWFTLQVLFRLLFKNKESELVFISTPPFTPFLGLFFKRIFRQHYHLVIWDLYPEALLAVKSFNKKSFIYQRWQKSNRSLFNKATTVITVGNEMAKGIRNYLTNGRQPKIIHNWINNQYITPKPKADNRFAKEYNQLGKLTIMYSGNMGDTHDFETVLKAAENLKTYRDISFIMIGNGSKSRSIKETVKGKNLDNVIVLPHQDPGVFPYAIATGDIGVVTLDKNMGNVSVPSKTYALLASGNSLLALGPKDSELALIINQYNCGQIFENGDVEGVTGYILLLYKNMELLEEYKMNARIASQDFTPLNAKLYYNYIAEAPDGSETPGSAGNENDNGKLK